MSNKNLWSEKENIFRVMSLEKRQPLVTDTKSKGFQENSFSFPPLSENTNLRNFAKPFQLPECPFCGKNSTVMKRNGILEITCGGNLI